MKRFTLFFLAIAAIVVIAAGSSFAQSCPMCKESMTQAGAKLSEGFYNSIMSMFILPISLIGGGTLFVMKSSWIKQHPESENYSTIRVVREMIKERMSRK